MTELIAQIVGIAAMSFNILSFQCKKTSHLMAALGFGSLLFATNFILIGAFASAGFNLVNILRSAGVINKKMHNNIFFFIVCILYVLTALVTYESLWTLVLLFSQLMATYSMWYKSGTFIRKAQLFCVSPIWLVNNSLVSLSIGGIICEAFTMVSVIISFFRFRKKEVNL